MVSRRTAIPWSNRRDRRLSFFLVLGIVVLDGCDTPGVGRITVMTRNLYLGTNLDPVINATPAQLPTAVAELFAHVQATNFAERAGRLADEIAATRPDVIGLQEVALYRRQSPGDAIDGGTTPATTPVIDFQQLLLDSLAARGLPYVSAATRTGLDLEVPMATGTAPSGPRFDDIRFTDRDVILARGDLPTSQPQAADFSAQALVTVGGVVIHIPRGWVSVLTAAGSTTIRVVNTHLEVQAGAPVQEAQAEELIRLLGGDTRPILLVGDFNSAANVVQTRSYGLLTGSGFTDTWAQAHPGDPGPTCCQAADLMNSVSTLDQRLDFVFWHQGSSLWRGGFDNVGVEIVGDAPAGRTASGLWPSDHAGVVATLSVAPLATGP